VFRAGWLLTGSSANCQVQEGPEKVLFSGAHPRAPYMSILISNREELRICFPVRISLGQSLMLASIPS